ncbi:hypothetical protein F5882DRAFT_143263 [Hyaloscypha sp. PMI_1271]|nr:hypothetical protein F5882DRAFT_143263 [Hyaloscypha sp. PMI_1271]
MAPPPPLDTYACYALPHQTLVVVPVKFFLAAAIDQVTTRYLRRLGYHVSDYLFLDPTRLPKDFKIFDPRRVPWNQIAIPNSSQKSYLSLRFSIGLTAIFFSITFSYPFSGIASSRGWNCSTSCFPLRFLASLITFNLSRTLDQTLAARKFVTKPTPSCQ